MNKSKIYVGNLAYSVTGDDLRNLFTNYGEIADVKVITDFETGRSKGFGFVTFVTEEAANTSLEMDGKEYEGRRLKVNIARDNRTGGGAGPRGGRGGRGGYSNQSRGENDRWGA